MDTELYKAATSGNINLFLEKDSSFFLQVTMEKSSALHLAVKFNQKKFVEKIINLHPQLLYKANSKGDTPLHTAAKVGCLEITKLLTNVESEDVEAQMELLKMVNLEKDTALHCAVRSGHIEIVKLLIKKDPGLTLFINENGDSPLFLAVDRNLLGIASHILKAAPTCSYQGRNDMNVLHAAVIRHQFNSFLDVWVRYHDNSMVFYPIIFIHQVLTSIKHACPPVKEELDSSGFSSELAFMNALIQNCKNAITEADKFGWTPLHYATYLCHTEAVQLLLENDGQVAFMKDIEGMSALHVAAKEGHVVVMKQLITFCPETCELLDYRGRTALHVAVESEKVSVVKYILKTPGLEGLINQPDKDGNTPLHLAALCGYHNIVTMLADDSRVDKGTTNKEGFAAVEIFLSKTELRKFRKCWIAAKLERDGGPPSLKGMVIRENIKMENVEMKEQPQHIKRKEDTVDYQEINNLALDSKADPKFRRLKDRANTHLLVATIIATVTFSAGFTMPGGYESQGRNQGIAVLCQESAFKAFLIADTSAFCGSAVSMLIHFWASLYRNFYEVQYYIRISAALTLYSIIGMVIAFIFGTNAVLAGSSGFATANLSIGFGFFVIFCFVVFNKLK